MDRIASGVLASVSVALGLAAAVAVSGRSGEIDPATRAVPRPVWTEVRWPFSADPWGPGKAYVCRAADCSAEIRLYLRAKLGLCNCATGIQDDADLEGMGDLYLVGTGSTPLGEGRQITVAHMKGRSRAYGFTAGRAPGKAAITVAYSDRCDMVVATGIFAQDRTNAVESLILEFLNSALVLRWAEKSLGL